jgi:hypothetical protein
MFLLARQYAQTPKIPTNLNNVITLNSTQFNLPIKTKNTKLSSGELQTDDIKSLCESGFLVQVNKAQSTNSPVKKAHKLAKATVLLAKR